VSHTLKAQLKKVKELEGRINPDRAWVKETRSALLNTIATTSAPVRQNKKTQKTKSVFDAAQALFPTRLMFQAKPFFVSLLVFGLAASGWIASASASGSLPGDTLWQIKLASEKTQIVLASITGNDKKNVELQLKFAARRVEEIKTVAAEETFAPEEKVKRTGEGLKQLQESIASVGTAVTSEEQKEDIGKNAKQLNESTTKISETLKEVATNVQDVDTEATLTKQVAEVQQAVDEVGINAVKAAVEGAKNDAERIAAEALVEEKIVSVLSEADGALHDSAEVKALAEKVDVSEDKESTTPTASTTAEIAPVSSSSTKDAATSASSSEMDSTGTSTPSAIVPLTSKQTITAILEQVDRSSEAVQKQIDEIKVLIDQGDLSGALEKAKELRKTTTEATKQTIEIKKTVEQVTLKKTESASGDTTSTTNSVPDGSSTTVQKEE